MTRETIIRMARQAGGTDITSHGHTTWIGTQTTEFLERFAAAVREECASIADQHSAPIVAAKIRQ